MSATSLAHLAQIVGEVERGARAVRAVHDFDGLCGKLGRWVERLDRRVVPFADLAEENLFKRRSVENEFAALDALDIDDGDDAAHDHGELDEPIVEKLLLAERLVGGAEGHRLGFNLFDSAARADRSIDQLDARLILVGVGPFRIDQIGEGRARAGNCCRCQCRAKQQGERQARGCRKVYEPHGCSPAGGPLPRPPVERQRRATGLLCQSCDSPITVPNGRVFGQAQSGRAIRRRVDGPANDD